MFEQEYVKRLIKSGVNTLYALFAGKDAIKGINDTEDYNIAISEDELLNLKIRKYIKECKINEAENALFEAIKIRRTKENLKTALLFYEEISKWDNEKLIQSNFSKSEIEQGLNDLKKLYAKK